MLNTRTIHAVMNGNKIKSAVCLGTTDEIEYTINANQFIDCSGDRLLAATAGAEYRTGRESRDEFGEDHAPEKADGWTMGNCIMMVTRNLGKPVPFKAPYYAIPFDHETAFKDKLRKIKQVNAVPPELIKTAKVEARVKGKWVEVVKIEENITRLMKTSFEPVKTTAIRVIFEETWGYKNAKLYEVRLLRIIEFLLKD